MNSELIKKSKYKKLFLGSVAFLIIVIILLYFNNQSSVFTDNAYLKSDITIIRPKVTGYVKEILVNDNQKVKLGDVIAKIDDQDYQLKVNIAKNNLDSINSKLKSIEDSLAIQDLTIEKTNYLKNAAKATFDKAQKDYNRFKVLAKDKAIATSDLDIAISAEINAQNNYEAARLDHEIQILQKSLLLRQKEEIQASLLLSKSNLALAQLDLDNTIIRSPVDGVISGINLQIGQLTSASLALAYLVHDNIWIIANFKETQTSNIKKGSKVSIKIDSFPDKKFNAIVESLSPASGSEFSILPSENATGNFTKIVQRVPVKIKFIANQDLSNLRTGLSTQVTVYND